MSNLIKPLEGCRICGSKKLSSVMNFGKLALTGVFVNDSTKVPSAELELGICLNCGLAQLMHTYDLAALYGVNYGYESHLNSSMVRHLKGKAKNLENRYLGNSSGAVVVDIASNDGTLLSGYSNRIEKLVGIDPLIGNFSDFYPEKSTKIQEFFSAEKYWQSVNEPASLVTSLSVLYDLDEPKKFARDVYDILDNQGIWHLEQSYLPTMIQSLSYDTVCHEHLLYLTLNNIKTLLDDSGFQLVSASLNQINGGSIAVTAIKTKHKIDPDPFINYLLKMEVLAGYDKGIPIQTFAKRAKEHKSNLLTLIQEYLSQGRDVVGLGASTKGNVLLQWLGLSSDEIRIIGDINPKKYGLVTPGSKIPIDSEESVMSSLNSNAVALVLPWHFREGITRNSEAFLNSGGSLIYPLPNIEVVNI